MHNVAFGIPKTMKSCPSHCETAATGQSLTHGSNCCEEGRKKIASPSNVLHPNHCDTEPLLKTMKSCPSHCETSATRQSVRKLRRERIRKGRAPAGFASKPLQECNLKNLETLLLEPLKNNEIVPHKNNENVPQPLRNVRHQAKPKKAASGAHPKGRAPAGFASKPLQECSLNENVPQPLRNVSHQAKRKKAASGAHPKRQKPSRFCVQAIAGVQPQKSRNVAFGTPKNNEIVPQPLRNFSHQAKPKKAASGAHPKRQSPSRFASKPLRNCNLKNLETLLLEPLKTMKSCPSHCETSATRQSLRKLRRERIRKGRAPCSRFCGQAIAELQPQKSRNVAFGTPKNNEIVPQPLRNCSHQAKPKKAGAHPKRQSPSRFCIAGVQPQKSRNVAFGTPKNNEIVPQPLRNFSHQAKPKKAASGAHPKRQSPSRFCVQAIAELQPQKSRNVAFGTPKNNEIVPQPLRNCSHQAKPKKAGAHPKRQSPSRFCVQAIAGVQPQKSRNVAFGTPKNNEIVPQPLRNFSHQAKPKKAASGAHPKRQSPSRFCGQAIAELQPQKSRNVAFGTPKNNEIVPQPLRNCSHQAKPKKAGAHPKRQSPSRFCVQAIAGVQPQKSRNVAFGTPKNNEFVPQPLRNFSHQAKPKKAASGAHPKRQSPSRFCVQAIAELQPQKSRNVAFGTPKKQ